jgi:hypothetical protein
METLMTYVATLRQHLDYVGTTLPNTLLEATLYAVDLGAVAATRGGVEYTETLQELTACRPDLLDRPALLDIYEAGQERGGLIMLDGDSQVLFLFHSINGSASDRVYKPSVCQVKPQTKQDMAHAYI